MKDLFRRLVNRETILYLIFGVLTTAVNYAVFWLLFRLFGEDGTLLINAAAFLCAVTFAYVTNKLFVFESKSWAWSVIKKEIPAFLGARIFTFALEELGLWLYAVSGADWALFGIDGTLIAKAVLTVVVIVLNYVFSKLYIFKGEKNET